jgi:hypothetical protein
MASVFSSRNLEKRGKQVLPGSEVGEREREGVQGERWPKQRTYI